VRNGFNYVEQSRLGRWRW